MCQLAAYRIIALVLLLAVSHIALATHEAAHSGADVVQCELCFSHAQTPVATIHSNNLVDFDVDQLTHIKQIQNALIYRNTVRIYHSRAPPVFV